MTDLRTRNRPAAESATGRTRRRAAAAGASPAPAGQDGPIPAQIFPARIVSAGPDAQSFNVQAAPGMAEQRARTADSCLIAPDLNDLVLCAGYPSGDGTALYILSVLVRADISRAALLNAAGGLTLSAPDGAVTIHAGQSVNILGNAGLNLTTENLSVRAGAAVLNLDSAVLESANAVASIGTLRLLGDKLLSLVKVISGHHQRASRKVAEVDQVQAGEVLVSAENQISHQAHQIVHVSTEDMRFDGARIHMG